jgi:hypothetical protein
MVTPEVFNASLSGNDGIYSDLWLQVNNLTQ